MATIITNKQVNEKVIKINNSFTSVFIETICLAGSDVATEEFQKDMMIWFGERDWTILGIGNEGFDLVELIWDKNIFDKQKEFILKVVGLAHNKRNWELLNYVPGEAVFEILTEFKKMLTDFKEEHISPEKEIRPTDFNGEIKRYDRCDKHKIYKHFQGCVICNNEPIENL